MELLVLTLRPPASFTDAEQAWLVDAQADLIGELRERLRGEGLPERVALVLQEPATADAGERAALAGVAEGLRGIAQALTLELAPRTRVNAVLCGDEAGQHEALALLRDPDGGFIAGATLDLRGAA
jgi:hypothetical protein